MSRRIFHFVFLIFGLLLTSIAMAKNIVLRSMQVNHSQNQTAITFQLSATAHYRGFFLQNPNRFVLDLDHVKTYQRLSFQNINAMPFHGFKYAVHEKRYLRVVFDLKNNVKPYARTRSDHEVQVIFPKTVVADIQKKSVYQAPKVSSPIQSPAPQKRAAPVEKEVNTESAEEAVFEKAVLSENENDADNKGQRNVVIVIDPGHGGKDPGATGPGGTHEKDIVLSISKKVQSQINKMPGFRAVLTRTGDYYLTLRQRLAIARHDKADMFVAIHADTWRNTQARGVSVFALSQRGATSEAARWLAKRENASELMGGVDLQDKSHLLKSVLLNLSQSATIRSSLEIGQDVMQSVRPLARLHHNRVEQAAFVVLKSPDIPSLLIETGFLSNPREEKNLRSQTYQTKLATAIMNGISRYFTYYPPRGTWLSFWRSHPKLARKQPSPYQS